MFNFIISKVKEFALKTIIAVENFLCGKEETPKAHKECGLTKYTKIKNITTAATEALLEMKEMLDDANLEIQRLKDENKTIDKEVDSLEEAMEKMTQNNLRLHTEKEYLQEENESLTAEINEIRKAQLTEELFSETVDE